MLLALLAGSALGSMPLPLYGARSMDVSGVPVLASLPGPAWIWADVTLDTAGKPVACTVASSSGSALLDRVACARATRAGRFAPARDEAGQPVAAVVRQAFAVNTPLPPEAVDFALPVKRARGAAAGGVAVTDVRVVADPAGKVLTCAIDRSSGVAALDTLACDAVFGVVRTVVRDASGVPVRGMSRASVGFVSGAIATR
jgi:hypothetical protein